MYRRNDIRAIYPQLARAAGKNRLGRGQSDFPSAFRAIIMKWIMTCGLTQRSTAPDAIFRRYGHTTVLAREITPSLHSGCILVRTTSTWPNGRRDNTMEQARNLDLVSTYNQMPIYVCECCCIDVIETHAYVNVVRSVNCDIEVTSLANSRTSLWRL